MQYLRDVYNSVILKDVVMRNAIRDVDLLGRLIFYPVSYTHLDVYKRQPVIFDLHR